MTVQCALAGERVVWVPRAVTYDEQPLDYAVSVTQRRRWTSGTIQVAGRYLSRLGQGAEQGSRPLVLADVAALLVVPFYQAAALGLSLIHICKPGLSGRLNEITPSLDFGRRTADLCGGCFYFSQR